ncbi:MAG: hypothetical protein AAB621_02345, partial [Patescibacteria group bacterium]
MRPKFEKDLRSFSEVAKEELSSKEKEVKDEDLDRIIKVVSWHLEKAAEGQHTNTETQKEIYNIQKRKQEIMQRLKEQLACLDNPECYSEKEKNERSAEFDKKNNSFRYRNDRGEEQRATFGEIMTDSDWGVIYHIDEKISDYDYQKRTL